MVKKQPPFYFTDHATIRWKERVMDRDPTFRDVVKARLLGRNRLKKMRPGWPSRFRSMSAVKFFSSGYRVRKIRDVGTVCFVTEKRMNGQHAVITVFVLDPSQMC